MKQVVVIGGGVVGLTTAWALVQAGHRVTLVERAEALAEGASRANGGQLSYRYVSPLADAGVPLKALGWLLDRDGPLRFRPDGTLAQWRWLAAFLARCRGDVNRRMTARLLALGAFSQQSFMALQREAALNAIELRSPGKLVAYRKPASFARAAASADGRGPERALSRDECLALEPSLADCETPWLAGGIFTAGEAVADCHALCLQLAQRLAQHPGFAGVMHAQALGFLQQGDRVVAVRTSMGEIAADDVVLAAGLQSTALAAPLGLRLPLYPLKGYSLSAPIAGHHRPPAVSVTDFERKTLYARIGQQLRVAAMVDLVGDDTRLDPGRLAALHRTVRASFPKAADYAQAVPWAGLRPATPSGAPMLGATPVRGLWLNVGHGALGFTFSFGSARILADLVSGRPSPLDLEGLGLRAA
ncbi:D-amino acid dehydrogenase [Roseateles terrae]|uniref:D-amino-acid dehydrogenase n=1 Tax=Roseateles terrae TaxID=431060 RepID=A0ABR6GRV3_9BURK|nr:D-amino acid dehydrogenase [Roseateles terrae]MBB3194843.1 D-amino-acid dehydrogenase [Roseateles terrae]OWQ85891.1 amino acid dehydrogenase [Roseateles terrae]